MTQVFSVLHDFRHFSIIMDWDTGFDSLRVMLRRTKNICSKIRTFPVWHQNLGSDLEREAGGCADKNFWTKQHVCSAFLSHSPSSLTEFEICDEGYLLHTVHNTVHGWWLPTRCHLLSFANFVSLLLRRFSKAKEPIRVCYLTHGHDANSTS